MLGSAAKYVSNITKKKFSSVEFASNMIVGTFLSLMLGLACMQLNVPTPLACLISGLGCYSGYKFVDVVFDQMRKKDGDKKIDDELDSLG
jgi:hypothetical protein